jgi:pimeloyl-ACP methyl ester carboxylesterase
MSPDWASTPTHYRAGKGKRLAEGSGHYPHLDRPERVAEAIAPFLRRQLYGSEKADDKWSSR